MIDAGTRSETAAAPKQPDKLGRSESQEERQPALSSVRLHGVLFTKYVFWALSFAFLLLIGNAYFALVQRWLALFVTARQVVDRPNFGQQ